MAEKSRCPTKDQLENVMRGKADLSDVERISNHVESCPECEQTLQQINAADTLGDQMRAEAKRVDQPIEAAVRNLIEKVRVRSKPLSESTAAFEGNLPRTDGTLGFTKSEAGCEVDHDLHFLSPSQADGELGRLGEYRVLKVLGKGGMGMVFKGHDPRLDRLVALKVMLPHVAANGTAKERFLREARSAAKLKSDYIVTIYQVGEERGVPFLAMEYLEGAPLDQFLAKGRKLTVTQILRIAKEVTKGLADAHERGLIHRDIKPGNIWLDKAHGGRSKILDFGLARANDDVHVTHGPRRSP
jgi:hypothetical protein